MLDVLLARMRETDRKDFMRAGIIAAAVINFSEGHPDRPVSPMDFVPGHDREKTEDLTKMTPEEQAAKIISSFGKKDYVKR